MSGLYIHIPFCASRCTYCGFYSTVQADRQDAYVDALCKEMDMRRLPEGHLSTVYLGGGTPSLLCYKNLAKIFDHIKDVYDVDWANTEVTLECNPDDITEDFCAHLRKTPVNRVSMGAQTFSDKRLRLLHRRHTAAEVPEAVRRLRNAGIENISVDLMFAFPNETLSEWETDIEKAIALNVEHISAYSLQYEEGTPLYHMLKQGKISEIDEDTYRNMYSLLCDKLAEAGYEHYEISNFSQPGRRSRHNSSYWHNIPYIGLGASAHSYDGKTRRSWNISSLNKYIEAINEGRRPSQEETIDDDTHYDDTVMTALRTCEGIDLTSLSDRHRKYLLRNAGTYISDGEMKITDNHLALTRNGIYISDMIMSDLMMAD